MTRNCDVTTLKSTPPGVGRKYSPTIGAESPSESLDLATAPSCPQMRWCEFGSGLIDGEAGALFCNQCFAEKNGDGLAALVVG